MTDWESRTATIQAGDKVACSKHWLQSTGQFTGDVPQARGTVLALERVGSLCLAVVDWYRDDLPPRVNVKNLSLVKNGVVIERE